MMRRPLIGAAALCVALLLSACNGSPEAGQLTPAPTSSGPSTPPTPSVSITASPAWTEEELQAITAARSRYAIAQAAVVKALSDPRTASRAGLENSGNGGQWLTAVLNQAVFQRDRGLYQTGSSKIVSTAVSSVHLQLEQAEVTLAHCIDGSGVVLRYRASGKPVPTGPSDGARHRITSRIVLAATGPNATMWLLVDEKVVGSC
ncbi:MAG TPA: hypothetical protein VFT31_11290 [Kribbella sp.]|nr:hypothetical protein [Kribbella sp.]